MMVAVRRKEILNKKLIHGINDGLKFDPLFTFINDIINKNLGYADKINTLRDKILLNRGLFKEDIAAVFGKGYTTNRISKLNSRYKKSGLLRKCGNPYFIHQIDMAIIVHVLGMGEDVVNTCIDHDTVENFAIKASDSGVQLGIEEELESIPFDHIRDNVNILTNKHRIIASYLDRKTKYDNKSITDADHMFFYLDGLERKIKDEKLLKAINHTRKLLGDCSKRKKKGNVILYLVDKSYRSYCYDIKTELENKDPEKILSVMPSKFDDRVDNTRSDVPVEHLAILGIYKKNNYILSLGKGFESTIINEENRTTGFLYFLLIDVSFRQLLKKINNLKEDIGEENDFYVLRFRRPIEELEYRLDKLFNVYGEEWRNYNQKVLDSTQGKKNRLGGLSRIAVL